VFPSDARGIYEAIGTEAKTLELVPGAHYFEEGEDRRAEIARLLVDWLGR
jgi:hypothetical protein